MKTGPSIDRANSRQDFGDSGAILKLIPDEPNYAAGNDGHIYSLLSAWGPRKRPMKMIAHSDKDGYLRIILSRSKRRTNRMVHRLIAAAFIGRPPQGLETRHKDGSKTNNLPENLEWGTQLDNAKDRNNHGRTAKGERIKSSKLKAAEVLNIKSELKRGALQKHLAAKYSVHKSAIQAIASKKTWKWQQDPA